MKCFNVLYKISLLPQKDKNFVKFLKIFEIFFKILNFDNSNLNEHSK